MEEFDMWSNLAHDLLVTICESLTIPDIFSFASVCRSWRSAAALKDKNRHLQNPWLVFSAGGSSETTTTFANFYSISDGRFFAIEKEPHESLIPSLNTCLLIGSDHGWIIAADERSELLLINPMTRKTIALPPVSTFDIVKPRFVYLGENKFITSYRVQETEYDSDENVTTFVYEYAVENLRYNLYWKACISSSPSDNGDDDYIVVVLLHNLGCLAFARSGDDKWTMMHDVLKPLFIVDMVFHCYTNDDAASSVVLLTTNERGMVEEWDLSEETVKHEEFLPVQELDSDDYFFYLVHTTWGDLLHVRRLRGEEGACDYRTCKFEVYKVVERTLVKVESLGHHALFLGGNSPVCISTKDSPPGSGLKGNCVYFTDEYSEFSQYEREDRRDIGIYNLEDGSIQPILPNDTRFYWPPPLWFTPSLLSSY